MDDKKTEKQLNEREKQGAGETENSVNTVYADNGEGKKRKRTVFLAAAGIIAAVFTVAGCAAASHFGSDDISDGERMIREEYFPDTEGEFSGTDHLPYDTFINSFYEDGMLHVAGLDEVLNSVQIRVSPENGEEEIAQDEDSGIYYEGKWYSERSFISEYYDNCRIISSGIRDGVYTALTKEPDDGREDYWLYVSDLNTGETKRKRISDITGQNADETEFSYAGVSYYDGRIYAAGSEMPFHERTYYIPCIYVIDTDFNIVDTITVLPVGIFNYFVVNDDGTAVMGLRSVETSACVVNLKDKSVLNEFKLEDLCVFIPGTDVNHMYYQQSKLDSSKGRFDSAASKLYSIDAQTAESELIRDFAESDKDDDAVIKVKYCSDSGYVYSYSLTSVEYTELVLDAYGNITESGPELYLEHINRFAEESAAVKVSKDVRNMFSSGRCDVIDGDDVYRYYAVNDNVLYGIDSSLETRTRLQDLRLYTEGRPDAVISDAAGNMVVICGNEIIRFVSSAPYTEVYTEETTAEETTDVSAEETTEVTPEETEAEETTEVIPEETEAEETTEVTPEETAAEEITEVIPEETE